MRRAQSVRHYPRPSLALVSDDLGVLREGEETNEDVLRRQLLDKDRECDKLETLVQSLHAQLAQRPSLEEVETLQREFKELEVILQGTQRENERCMAEVERGKTREKMLERELAKAYGENWQSSLEIASPPPSTLGRTTTMRKHQSISMATHNLSSTSLPRQSSPERASNQSPTAEQQEALLAHIQQVRMLIMGMEQRLETREGQLNKEIHRAEEEGKKYEAFSRDQRLLVNST